MPRHYTTPPPLDEVRTCERATCDGQFRPRVNGRPRRFCSQKCQAQAYLDSKLATYNADDAVAARLARRREVDDARALPYERQRAEAEKRRNEARRKYEYYVRKHRRQEDAERLPKALAYIRETMPFKVMFKHVTDAAIRSYLAFRMPDDYKGWVQVAAQCMGLRYGVTCLACRRWSPGEWSFMSPVCMKDMEAAWHRGRFFSSRAFKVNISELCCDCAQFVYRGHGKNVAAKILEIAMLQLRGKYPPVADPNQHTPLIVERRSRERTVATWLRRAQLSSPDSWQESPQAKRAWMMLERKMHERASCDYPIGVGADEKRLLMTFIAHQEEHNP